MRDRDGHLAIAKFPNKGDETDAVLWEALALTLARQAGIGTPAWRIVDAAGSRCCCSAGYRIGKERVPFLSAMSMLDARDNESRSYMEFVDVLRLQGATPKRDMHQLWRRVVFNILIFNTDDHLRNHGFLYVGQEGWTLSPAYDMNPVPVQIKPRVLTTTIDFENGTASLELAMQVAAYFELKAPEARKIAAKVGSAVGGWRFEAAKLGIAAPEVDRMASAFEYRDPTAAQAAA